MSPTLSASEAALLASARDGHHVPGVSLTAANRKTVATCVVWGLLEPCPSGADDYVLTRAGRVALAGYGYAEESGAVFPIPDDETEQP